MWENYEGFSTFVEYLKLIRMKKFLLLTLLSCVCTMGFAQTYPLNIEATVLRDNGRLKKGQTVVFGSFTHETVSDPTPVEQFYITTSNGERVDIMSNLNDYFMFKYDDIQCFWDAQIITNVLHTLKSKGVQYGLRREMEEDALEYINRVDSYGLILNDPYLENYIYSLIAKISPQQLIDGRPGNVNVIIQHNPRINACCYPNGTIVLNTGLLSVLHSEDELVAILAHEIAHFILDHSVQNVNKAEQRQRRAEFWAAMATGITAVAEGVAAVKNNYYVPGAATLSMAVLSTSIGSQVVKRLGMQYNHEQEKEADNMAIQVLCILGYDVNALSTALSRMEREYVVERNNAMYVNSFSHPALVDRINNTGTPSSNVSVDFERMVSFAITDVARMKYEDRRFRQCLPLVSQNIKNGVAQADDYILKSNCILATQNTTESNLEALELINKAKMIDSENINICKTEIIATLRLNRISEAITLLQEYNTKIEKMVDEMKEIRSDETWDAYLQYVTSERSWVSKMLVKLKGM